jgi:hypothetical protein
MKKQDPPHEKTGFAGRLLAELSGPGLDSLYADRVLPQPRRRVDLVGRVTPARVQKALWGFEVRMGRRRKTCPDEVTARYLRLFAVMGFDHISIPYNPVQTGRILPELEQAFQEMHRRLLAWALAEPSFSEVRRQFPDVPDNPPSFEAVTDLLESTPAAREWRRQYHLGKRRVYGLLRRRIGAAERAADGGPK